MHLRRVSFELSCLDLIIRLLQYPFSIDTGYPTVVPQVLLRFSHQMLSSLAKVYTINNPVYAVVAQIGMDVLYKRMYFLGCERPFSQNIENRSTQCRICVFSRSGAQLYQRCMNNLQLVFKFLLDACVSGIKHLSIFVSKCFEKLGQVIQIFKRDCCFQVAIIAQTIGNFENYCRIVYIDSVLIVTAKRAVSEIARSYYRCVLVSHICFCVPSGQMADHSCWELFTEIGNRFTVNRTLKQTVCRQIGEQTNSRQSFGVKQRSKTAKRLIGNERSNDNGAFAN